MSFFYHFCHNFCWNNFWEKSFLGRWSTTVVSLRLSLSALHSQHHNQPKWTSSKPSTPFKAVPRLDPLMYSSINIANGKFSELLPARTFESPRFSCVSTSDSAPHCSLLLCPGSWGVSCPLVDYSSYLGASDTTGRSPGRLFTFMWNE